MPPTESTVDRPEAAGRELDAESLGWRTALRDRGAVREQGIADLHAVLLRIARSETHRRSGRLHISGPELEDLGHQAADDALLAIIAKLEQFRGESRFTTWACTFVIVEVSTKIGRHFWRTPTVATDAEDWDRPPDRFGLDPPTTPRRVSWSRHFVARSRRSSPRARAGFSSRSGSTASRWTRWSLNCGPQPQRDLQDNVRRPT